MIGLTINNSFLLMIGDEEMPKAMWDALKEHLQSDSLANELFLHRKFYQAHMSNGVLWLCLELYLIVGSL